MTRKQFQKGHKTCVGKKNARKLKTDEQMTQVYKSYCEHLAAGKVKKSWYFDENNLTLTWETMEKYIANEPQNFDPQKKAVAVAKGMAYWESIVDGKAIGTHKEADTATLQMNMRNKYGWDKNSENTEEDVEPYLKILARKWRGK